MDNIVAEVISLPDLYGVDHMNDYMASLFENPAKDSIIKIGFITKALDALATVPKSQLPQHGKDPKGNDYFVGFHLKLDPIDGVEYELRPKAIKALGQQPIYELRLSVEFLKWHFRATFFPKYHPMTGQFFYCLVHPFEKEGREEGLADPTNHYMQETYDVFDHLKRHFDHYSKYFDDPDQ
ncbi:hypothetical protein [Priestia megaterium]